MKTKSAKAKGRRLQQFVRDELRALMPDYYGLKDDDILSRGMGQAGEDIILSPHAKDFIPLSIECKNKERINVAEDFANCKLRASKDSPDSFPILVHSKNRSDVLVTLEFKDFMKFFKCWIDLT